jgi:putative membrane protein
MLERQINKDLILRERLALQRTILANQSTFLAFLRTSMYFFIAGLSLESLLNMTNSIAIEIYFFGIFANINVFFYCRFKFGKFVEYDQ